MREFITSNEYHFIHTDSEQAFPASHLMTNGIIFETTDVIKKHSVKIIKDTHYEGSSATIEERIASTREKNLAYPDRLAVLAAEFAEEDAKYQELLSQTLPRTIPDNDLLEQLQIDLQKTKTDVKKKKKVLFGPGSPLRSGGGYSDDGDGDGGRPQEHKPRQKQMLRRK